MKRQQLNRYVLLLAPILCFLLIAPPALYAQGRSGELPGPKPTPTPAPKSPAKVTRPSTPAPATPPVTPTLTYNQGLKGRLDPNDSEKAGNGSFFEDHILNAKSQDLLTIQLQSDASSLGVQILDKNKAEVPVAKDASPGAFRINTQSGGLPEDGEYIVRVLGAPGARNPIPYTLTINRVGLLPGVYNERFQKIVMNFRESDPASVDETVNKLEELGKDDANKPSAFEYLGIIYLYNRGDAPKAANAMEQAIKANGAAVVKISFDSQWRRMAKLRSGKIDWEDARSGWLRIRPGQLLLTDTGNRSLASLTGPQIKELSKIVTNTNHLVSVTVEGRRMPFVFLPGTKQQAEADLVIKLIQTHVMGKTN